MLVYDELTWRTIMRYIVLVSHGEYAYGLHSAIHMMTGKRQDVISVGLLEDITADQFCELFIEKTEKIGPNDEVILLTDLASGSPYKHATKVLEKKGVQKQIVLAGVNMPMALKAILSKDNILDFSELRDTLLWEGKSGIEEC